MSNHPVLRLATIAILGLVAIPLAQHANSEDKVSETVTKSPKVAIQNSETTEKEKYPWGWIRWLMSEKLDEGAPMTFGIVEIDAGQTNPLHMHPNCEEYLYVVSGSCKHIVGDAIVVLKEGDLARIPANTPHKAMVLGDTPLKAVIVYSSGDRQVNILEAGGKD